MGLSVSPFPKGFPARVVFLSQEVTLDSNIDTGGGTDCTDKVQAILDSPTAVSPLWMYVDKVGLISKTLVARSFTTVFALANCGFFLAANSNCIALSNRLNGSSIVDTDISIYGLTVNCNGNNQSRWENNVDLSFTNQTATTTNTSSTITLSSSNAIVAIGMKVTGTGIPTDTYVLSVSGTTVTLTNNATASGTNSLLFQFASPYDRAVGLVHGVWFSGFKNLLLSGVSVIDSRVFSIVLSNGSDFVIERCKSKWTDNPGIQTLGTGATSSNTTITYAADPGYGTGAAVVQVGYTVNGPGIPANTTISAITSSTQATISNSATATASGLTFTFTKLTNNNRDGIHMWCPLDTGHIVDYENNGDDDILAFNTDEGILNADPRRGTGGDGFIKNITAENITSLAGSNMLRFYGTGGTGRLQNISVRNTQGVIIQGQQSCAGPTVAGQTYLGRIATDVALASVQDISIEGWHHTAISPGKVDLTMNSVLGLRDFNIPETVPFHFTAVEDYIGERSPTWQRIPFTPGSFYSSGTSGGGGVNTGNPIGYSAMNIYSGMSSGNYGLVQWQRTLNGYGSLFPADAMDWSIFFEARLQFQVDSTHVSSDTRYRWLLGRTDSDQTHPDTSSGAGRWLNGIGIEVNNLELYLVVNRHGTVQVIDTGYVVTADRTERITLRNVGNGIVRVYADVSGVKTLLYSTTVADGPVDTDQAGSAIEIHSTLTADDPNYNLVFMSNMEIKR
jgi:hypothetical protein